MFIRLLSTCKIGGFGEPLVSYSGGCIKCVSLNHGLCQHLSI